MHLRFTSLFRVIAFSLDSLVRNIKKHQLLNAKEFTKYDKMDLLIRKGVYPCDYMDCWNRFPEIKLPHKQAFYSQLNNCGIMNEDYDHAHNVWQAFNIKYIGEYQNLCLKINVLLLAKYSKHFGKLVWMFTN